MELAARGLLAHAESDHEEWGVSGSVRYAPSPDGRGLSLRLGSARGASSGSAERIWAQRPDSLAGESFDPGAGMDAEVAYGLDTRRGLLTPYTGVAYSGSGERWRAGVRWKLGAATEAGIEASLEQPANDDEPEGGVLLRGSWRW